MSLVDLVKSGDGTLIATERSGSGPALVLVEPPLHHRRLSAFRGLSALLSEHFTVHQYDRRGRGDSSDTAPYHPDREVEDLGAVIGHAGGSAFVYGYSAGALLALRAAAQLGSVARLAVLEPPLRDEGVTGPDPLTGELAALLAQGQDGRAVLHFHRCIGVPEEHIAGLTHSPHWLAMVGAARTLVYDCVVTELTTLEIIRAVTVPTLVLDSAGSSGDLAGWAQRVASLLPRASHRSLPGEWHSVADPVLARALTAFFTSR
jgi:pimeloyl-ACP methyl ester carboxylesterase